MLHGEARAAKPTRILYIEDDPGDRLLVRGLLEAAGYAVLEAEDGVAGIEIALREQPALILLDVNLPEIDGYAVAGALRTFPKLSAVPIVALTANDGNGDRQRTLVAGCDGYIVKPIDVDAFAGQVGEFLHGKRERAAAEDEGVYLRELNQRLVCRLLHQLDEVRQLNRHVTERARGLEDVHDALLDLTSDLGLVALLERLLPRLARALRATDLVVELSEPPGLRLAAAGRVPGAQGGEAPPIERPGLELKVPLVVRGRPLGLITASYFHGPGPDQEEEHLFKIAAGEVAIAVENARLYESERAGRAGAEGARRQSAYLARAGKALAASLDYESTLSEIVRAVVPDLADACLLDMIEPDQSVHRVVVAVGEPARQGLASAPRRSPADPASSSAIREALRTGRSRLLPTIPDELLTAVAGDAEHLRQLQEGVPRSAMVVPVSARGRALGVLTLVALSRPRSYGADDVALAEEFGARAALALDNARLYREVVEADRRKNEFLAVLAHELRAPLAPVLSAMSIVARYEGEDVALRQAREIVERQVRHQARILDDLLDLARISHGKVELRWAAVRIRTVIENALEVVRPLADAQGQRLTVSLPDDDIILAADATRLTQVLTNLLANAVRYSPAGGEIAVSASHEGASAVLRVRDTGHGIAPELLEKIFDPFTQLTAPGGGAHGVGLGVGLALVQRLIHLHGGTVEARSKGLGQGSEFVIQLPIDSLAESPAVAPAEAEPQRRRVLLVEDDADTRDMLRLTLQLDGHQVDVAGDGRLAIDRATAERPEVVLIDIGLPDIDGYEVARRLRSALGPDVLLVALTGFGRDEDLLRAHQAGFDVHLLKPVERDQLVRIMGRGRRPAA